MNILRVITLIGLIGIICISIISIIQNRKFVKWCKEKTDRITKIMEDEQ